mgnify:FL=1
MKKETMTNNSQKKYKIFLIFIIIVLIMLLIRIFYLQTVKSSYLKEQAYKQLVTTQVISTKRGTIYDSCGNQLAISSKVDTISINPSKIKDESSDEKTKNLKEKVAKALSEIFELDYEETLNKVNSEKSVETIAKKVEEEKVNKLKSWMKDNETYSGINIDSDTKRSYPYNNLASNLIGFCGSDNQGLEGIEYYWDSVLSGTPGKIVTTKDAAQSIIPDKNEQYIAAENGSNITLTIDLNIQTIVEKYLKQAVTENKCGRGGNMIIMDPSNGDILAMATYPDYNLNTPFEPNESLSSTWDKLSDTEKNNSLQKMWRNKSVSDTYEPGSTFKLITASASLEEGIVKTDTLNDFTCNGYEDVSGQIIRCTSSRHGKQTLRQALENSCNPALIQLGKRLGADNLYKYMNAFGLFTKTGIATSGEVTGIYFNKVGPVELATASFGQRFTITPIQLISAVSAIANNGVLMQPRIVKSVENPDTNIKTTINPVEVRHVISKETSQKMVNIMESVVTEGGGKFGQVKGYSIGGKTGTSEPSPGSTNDGYVSSFVAIAPVQNTKVVALLTLYDPNGKSFYGGQICAPVVSQVLSEILPYLGIPSNDEDNSTDTSKSDNSISLPDVRNKTASEAKKILENAGLNVSISGDQSKIVSDQVPKPGTSLSNGSIVKIYAAGSDARISSTVPDLKGMTLSQAKNALASKTLNIQYTGNGKVISQDPTSGTSVEEGSVVKVTLQEDISSSAH